MQPAPELREIVARLYQAFTQGDADLVERLTSRNEGIVFIGTDPNEWFEDMRSIRRLIQAQAGAGIELIPGDIRALREGSVGWVADQGRFRLADGTEIPFRLTGVFRQEDGDWKLVQEHASIGVSNEEALGEDLAAPGGG